VVVITKKNRTNNLPSVSGYLLRGVQRGTCVARWVCTQVRMWLDTTVIRRIVVTKARRARQLGAQDCGEGRGGRTKWKMVGF